jgi:hypothetical protein
MEDRSSGQSLTERELLNKQPQDTSCPAAHENTENSELHWRWTAGLHPRPPGTGCMIKGNDFLLWNYFFACQLEVIQIVAASNGTYDHD